MFARSGVTWSQQAYLKASNTGANDWFGIDVAISGDTIVVGASSEDSSGLNGDQGDNSAPNSGAAYVFVPAPNQSPVAQCRDVTLSADSACTAFASVDDGSYDPDGDSITLAQSPAGPYPKGDTTVTLTVTDGESASSSCSSTVTVTDDTPPAITAPPARVYVANHGSHNVSVINAATSAVVSTVPVGNSPSGVVISPDGARAYVTVSGENKVSIIDTATNAVVATVPVGSFPFGVAVTPDGLRVYVTNFSSNSVSVIATATNSVIATIPVGTSPRWVAVIPNGTRAYVTNELSGNVSVIDTATNTVIATVGVPGTMPQWVAIAPDGARAYVTVDDSNAVSLIGIDTATNTVVVSGLVGVNPRGLAVTLDGARAYVANLGSNTVSVFDTAAATVVATVPVAGLPLGVAVTPDGTRTYVTSAGANAVRALDTATNSVVASVPVGSTPFGLAVTPPPPAPPSVASADGSCQAAIPDVIPSFAASDACGAVTLTQSPEMGTPVSVGSHDITVTATDAAGNTSTVTTTFTVIDDTPPSPDVESLPTVSGECSVTVTAPTATDNCMGQITGTTTDPLTYSSVGMYAVRWTYNDARGNTSEQTQTVIVSQPQEDFDADGVADLCDSDDDNDTVADAADNCQFAPNPGQFDTDGDALGDVCDADDDGDGVADSLDNCSLLANSDQTNTDGDSQGNVCDADDDNDGITDSADNCPFAANPDQADVNNDGIGDACDLDDDGDGVPDGFDQCPGTPAGMPTGVYGCPVPTHKEQCKDNGWQTLFRLDGTSFKNHGDCVQYVLTGK